jgi:hypothetical protein
MQDCDCLTCIFESISRKGLLHLSYFLSFFVVHEYFGGMVFINGFRNDIHKFIFKIMLDAVPGPEPSSRSALSCRLAKDRHLRLELAEDQYIVSIPSNAEACIHQYIKSIHQAGLTIKAIESKRPPGRSIEISFTFPITST